MLGFGLRLVMLDRFRFHQDEALYSYWALHFLHEDPQFLTQWIDKPPLFIWLLSFCFKVFGVSEASARLLNVAVSTLTVPVVAAIARQAWTSGAALIAASACRAESVCHQLQPDGVYRSSICPRRRPLRLRRAEKTPVLGRLVSRRRNYG